MVKKFCCAIFLAFVAGLISLSPVFWIQANRIFALDKDVHYHHYEKCKKQSMQASIIDLEELNNEELLAVENDLMGLFQKGTEDTKQGRLLRVIDAAYGNPKFREVEIVNFPQNVAFRPFGLHIEDSTVYVLNQALHQGGSRIEIFNYTDEKALHTGSVLLDPKLGGTFGDLVIHKNFIYLNQYSSIPFDQSPTPLPLTSMLKTFYNEIIQVREAIIYQCPLTPNTKVDCKPMNSAKSASVTGITKDQQGDILAAFASIDYNWIERYEIESGNLKFVEKLPLRDKAERINFSKTVNRIYGGSVPWPMMMMTSKSVPGGVVEFRKVDMNSVYSQRRLLMQEDVIKGVTVAARVGNYVFSASFMENAVMVCPIVDP